MAGQVKQVALKENNTQLSGKGGTPFPVYTRKGGNPVSKGMVKKSGK